MVIMAIGGIDNLRKLGLMGKVNFKASKSLTGWDYLQQVKATAKTLKNVVFLGNSNRILSKDQILVSCSNMTCSLQNLHYVSIYISY